MLMIEQLVAPERPRRRPAAMIETTASGRRKMTMTWRLGPTFLRDHARRYREPILREAARRDLAPSLLLAVIQTESAVNPRAASPAPAYGLMQLVPRSGGADAYRFVNGRPRILDPEMLFVPDTNIKLGAAYLQLLLTRFPRAVDDPTSRLYCSIAAYNTGAGNVARAFIGTTSVAAAAPLISALAPTLSSRICAPGRRSRRPAPISPEWPSGASNGATGIDRPSCDPWRLQVRSRPITKSRLKRYAARHDQMRGAAADCGK